MKRVLLLTATIHHTGLLRDCGADGYILDECKLVYDTGAFPACLQDGGTWTLAEAVGDGVEVLRGAVVSVIYLPEIAK